MVKNNNVIIIILVIGLFVVGLGFGGTQIYKYFFDLEFREIESVNVEINSLEYVDEIQYYLDNTENFNDLFNNNNDSSSTKYIIEKNQNDNILKWNIIEGGTYTAFQTTAISIQEIINDFSAQGLNANDMMLRVENWNILDVDGVTELGYVPNRIRWNSFFAEQICDDILGTEGATGTSIFTGSGYMNNQIEATGVKGHYRIVYSNQVTNSLVCVAPSSFKSITISDSNLENFIKDYDDKDLISLWSGNEYNNLSQSMSFIINKNNNWNNYEMYFNVENNLLYLNNLKLIEFSDLPIHYRNSIESVVTQNTKIYGTYATNDDNINNLVSLIVEGDDNFMIFKTLNYIDNSNYEFTYIDKDNLNNNFKIGSPQLNLENIFSFALISIKDIGNDEILDLDMLNFNQLSVVSSNYYNQDLLNDFEFNYKLYAKDYLIQSINHIENLLTPFSNSRIEDMLKLEDNLTYIYNNSNYKFGDDTSVIIVKDLSIINGSVITISDFNNIDLNSFKLNLNNNKLSFNSDSFNFIGIGTIYNYPNLNLKDSKIFSRPEFDSNYGLLIGTNNIEFNNFDLNDNVNSNINEEVGYMFMVTSPDNTANNYIINQNFSDDKLPYDDKLYSSFIELRNTINTNKGIIKGNYNDLFYGNVTFLIINNEVSITTSSEGIRIKSKN